MRKGLPRPLYAERRIQLCNIHTNYTAADADDHQAEERYQLMSKPARECAEQRLVDFRHRIETFQNDHRLSYHKQQTRVIQSVHEQTERSEEVTTAAV